MTRHCCSAMDLRIAWNCDLHDDPFDCPDALVLFDADSREYGLIVHDGGSSSIGIDHCPWCGTRLSPSGRDDRPTGAGPRGADPAGGDPAGGDPAGAAGGDGGPPGGGGLPKVEFAFPGPLRDALVAAVLDGSKTSTTALFDAYARLGEELPVVGARQAVVDSADEVVAVIEVTGVRIATVAEVDLAHAVDEGEGYRTVAAWRAGHESFWHGAEVREEMGDPAFTVDDGTRLVLQRFRLVESFAADGGPERD